jgi:antitoxin ParD1/3/4
MPTRNVVLTDHQAVFVEQLVASGRFQNASEVLREGLRLIEQRDAEQAARIQAFRDAVQQGENDIAAGQAFRFNSAFVEAMTQEARDAVHKEQSPLTNGSA